MACRTHFPRISTPAERICCYCSQKSGKGKYLAFQSRWNWEWQGKVCPWTGSSPVSGWHLKIIHCRSIWGCGISGDGDWHLCFIIPKEQTETRSGVDIFWLLKQSPQGVRLIVWVVIFYLTVSSLPREDQMTDEESFLVLAWNWLCWLFRRNTHFGGHKLSQWEVHPEKDETMKMGKRCDDVSLIWTDMEGSVEPFSWRILSPHFTRLR